MNGPDRYTCERAFQALDRYVDRALGPDEVRSVEEHLETCAECAGEYRFECTLVEGLKQKIRRIAVPRSLVDKVAAILDAYRQP